MQGSYKGNGLPRPYYMSPSGSKRKQSPYDHLPRQFFTSPRRRLSGYLVMLAVISLLMYYISMDVRSSHFDNSYEIISQDEHEYDDSTDPAVAGAGLPGSGSVGKSKPYLSAPKKGNLADKLLADKELENPDLASNLASNSKGELGLGVNQAPKGGIANEAPIVGSDEDKIVGTGKGGKFKKVIDVDPTGKLLKEDGTVPGLEAESDVDSVGAKPATGNGGTKDVNGKVEVDVEPAVRAQRPNKKTGYKASKNGEDPEEDDTPKNSFQAQKKQQLEELKQKQEMETPNEEPEEVVEVEVEGEVEEDEEGEEEEEEEVEVDDKQHQAVSNEPPSADNA